MFAGGHVLIEGLPGLAKTTLARTLAQCISGGFKRIQFTSDLMPSDITGSNIYRLNDGSFNFIPGPIFTHVLLADELNRAPAKTQSALLEAMQERQVTVDAHTYALKKPFIVLATQNTDEEAGVYPLPESQLDRFMFRIQLGYPTLEQELKIITNAAKPSPEVEMVLSAEQVTEIASQIETIGVHENVARYIVDIIRATRADNNLIHGASPRAGTALLRAAQTFALLRGSSFVAPNDVKSAAPHVLNHRLKTRPESTVSVNHILSGILSNIKFN